MGPVLHYVICLLKGGISVFMLLIMRVVSEHLVVFMNPHFSELQSFVHTPASRLNDLTHVRHDQAENLDQIS